MRWRASDGWILAVGIWLAAGHALVWAQAAAGADSRAETRQALETLLGSLADGEALVGAKPVSGLGANPPTQPSRQRVVVRPGETLDAIVRRTLGHLPIKDAVLRNAFVEINPDAFVAGSVHRIRAGAELQVPSPEDVRRLIVRDSGAPSATSRSGTAPAAIPNPSAAPPTANVAADPPGADTRDWVRYP